MIQTKFHVHECNAARAADLYRAGRGGNRPGVARHFDCRPPGARCHCAWASSHTGARAGGAPSLPGQLSCCAVDQQQCVCMQVARLCNTYCCTPACPAGQRQDPRPVPRGARCWQEAPAGSGTTTSSISSSPDTAGARIACKQHLRVCSDRTLGRTTGTCAQAARCSILCRCACGRNHRLAGNRQPL